MMYCIDTCEDDILPCNDCKGCEGFECEFCEWNELPFKCTFLRNGHKCAFKYSVKNEVE